MAKVKRMESMNVCFHESKFSGLGFVLLIVGTYYLGRNLGWWPEIQFWPLFFVIIGLYLIIKKLSYKRL